MTTLADIRDAIVAKLTTVANVGQVHGYERFAKAEKDFRALYESGAAPDKLILGWCVRRARKRETANRFGRVTVYNHWEIRGFMGLADASASELRFDSLIEAIGDAFRADETLGGLVETMPEEPGGEAGIQVAESGPVMFAGVLCHSATLKLMTRHDL